MANPKRVQALLEMADEDMVGARRLLPGSPRLARYHVQQSAEKAVRALFEHRDINPGREHRFDVLARMLKPDDEWSLRIKKLDPLSPAATSRRYPTAEGRIIPPPGLELIESEIGTVTQLIIDIRKAICAPAPHKAGLQTSRYSEHERKIDLAKKIVAVARTRNFELPDNVEEKLAIYVDERTLREMTKDIQTASSFQNMLEARSIVIPSKDNS